MRKMPKLLLKKKEARYKKNTLKVILQYVKTVLQHIQVTNQPYFQECIGTKNNSELMATNDGRGMMNLQAMERQLVKMDNACLQ